MQNYFNRHFLQIKHGNDFLKKKQNFLRMCFNVSASQVAIHNHLLELIFILQQNAPIKIEVPDFDSVSPVHSSDPNDYDQDTLEQNLLDFVDIIIRQRCSHSVPSQHLQGITKSMLKFYFVVFIEQMIFQTI